MALIEDINVEIPVLYELGEIFQEHNASIKMIPSGDISEAFMLMYHGDCLDIFHSHISPEKLKYSSVFYAEGDEPWREFLKEFKRFIDENQILINGVRNNMIISRKVGSYYELLSELKGVNRKLEVNCKDFLVI